MSTEAAPYFDVAQLGYVEDDNKAYIGFKLYEGMSPFPGDIHFLGLTTEQCKELIALLEDYVSRHPA